MNPVRVKYIADHVAKIKGVGLNGLGLLDVGCGGGLLSEVLYSYNNNTSHWQDSVQR